MPFHAFFGIVLMMTNTPVAQNFYRTLAPACSISLPSSTSPAASPGPGDVVLLGVVIVLAVQWTRQDKRDAKRFDRHEDAGLSDEFAAYNDMLRRLAERDGVAVAADATSRSEKEGLKYNEQ